MKYSLLIFSFFLLIKISAQKNDTVFLLNGDKITGEFKKFDQGMLVFDTDAMGTLNIEFDKLGTICSSKYFEIIDDTAFTFYGSLLKSRIPGHVRIKTANDTLDRQIKALVQMYPIRKIFWKKFSGSLDLGLTYYKSSEMLQLNFGANIDYRTRKDNVTLTVGGIYSNQFEDDTLSITRKYDVGIDYSRNLKGRWEIGTGVKAQQNSELNLNYRFQVGLVTGYNVVHTNRVRFIITGGLMGNREEPIDSAFFETSLEGVIAAKVTWFQYKHPKIKIFSGINFYPSITISQRFRLEYALTVKYEIFNNFDLGVTLYDNYDTKPAGGGPALNDWGTVVSIGYTF